MVREQDVPIDFVSASWNGERYALNDIGNNKALSTHINLVLTVLNVMLNGKAKEDPKLILQINMQWAITKYNPKTQEDEVWDLLSGNYESEKHRLSEWLAEDGELLKTETDTGLEKALTYAFSDLPKMTKR